MTDHELRDHVLHQLQRPLPGWARPVFGALAAAGVVAFLVMVLGGGDGRAWRAYHVNWLFWTGLAQAGVMFSAVTRVARGRWAVPLRRMAEASGAFLPVALVLFLLLWLGRGEVFTWVRHPIEEPHVKAFWLRDSFLFARDITAMLLLFGLSTWYLYHSLRPDAALLQAGAPERARALYAWLARGWDQAGRGVELSEARRDRLAPALVVTYALVMSLLAFDLIMSLAPFWLSNLLGGFYFMGAWLSGLMSLALIAMFWRRHFALEDLITGKTLHDLGKLCFGFTVFWAYLFFSQFLVIWYGNLPEETSFLFLRMSGEPWRGISTLMVVLVFLVPFWGLIGVKPKKTPAIFATFASISLVGLWVDRYVLTVPSIVQEAPRIPLGWQELLVTAGFAGVWGLCYLWFADRFPLVSPSLLDREAERRHHPHRSE